MVRIFVIATPSLFSQGIERLLCHEVPCLLAGRAEHLEAAWLQIADAHPDVVLLAGPFVSGLNEAAAELLAQGLAARVLALDLEDCAVSVYPGGQRILNNVDDLIAVVAGSLARP